MYEIWLTLNIVYEIALDHWKLIATCFVLWLGLLWLARRDLSRRALPLSILLALLASLAAFFILPTINHASFQDMGYWVDWFNLAGWALTAGGIAWFVAFPLASLILRKRMSD